MVNLYDKLDEEINMFKSHKTKILIVVNELSFVENILRIVEIQSAEQFGGRGIKKFLSLNIMISIWIFYFV